jgi:putative transposase
LRVRLRALAEERRRFGYRRLHVLLRREGHAVNRKRVQRLYREEKLTVRRRGGRKRALGLRRPIEAALAPNQRWSLDFVSDQLTDGRRFRILAVVDDCTRECLALVADTSLSGRRVVRELDELLRRRGRPATVVSDNVLRSEGGRRSANRSLFASLRPRRQRRQSGTRRLPPSRKSSRP